MSNACSSFGPGMRRLLLFCGPMNFAGAVCFAPPFLAARRGFGLPEPAPFYLWVLSAWIAAFGAAYFHQGWSGQPNRAVLALGAWGKLVFAGLLMQMAVEGALSPFAFAAAVPDFTLAVVFGLWLRRSRRLQGRPHPGARRR